MNKEALKKEAIKYAVDYPTSYGKGYKHKDLRIAYLAGAEPREKKIIELKKENVELQNQYKTEKEKWYSEYTAMYDDFQKQIEELEKQHKIDLIQIQAILNQKSLQNMKLTKAKEIIKYLLSFIQKENYRTRWDINITKAEQFLKEIDK